MTTKLLHDTGAALYGPRWQTELARALDVSDRTMRRWASGTDNPPDGIAIDLLRLCTERAADIDDLIERLKCLSL